MLAALVRRVSGWLGRLVGSREPLGDGREPASPEAQTSVSSVPERRQPRAVQRASNARPGAGDRAVLPVRGESDEPDAAAVELAPIQPEAIQGTDAPLREAVRRSLVPRWVAALRTQTFTVLATIGLLAFAGLTFLVTGGLTADADLVATQTVQGVTAPWFGSLMLGVSLIGFAPQNIAIVGGIAGLLWRSGYRTEAGFSLAASASVLLTEIVKRVIARPRPDADLVTVIEGAVGHSFPSGHTLFYVTFFGFLAYLANAQLKRGRLRASILWLTGLLVLLVGPSRIWMGQHWASDVLASYALGLAYLVILVQAYGRRRLGTVPAAASASQRPPAD